MSEASSRRGRWSARFAAVAVVVTAFLVPGRSQGGAETVAVPGGRTTPDASARPATLAAAPVTTAVPVSAAAPTPYGVAAGDVTPPAAVATSTEEIEAALAEVVDSAPAESAPAGSTPPTAGSSGVDESAVVTAVMTDDGHLVVDRVPVDDSTDLSAIAADLASEGDLVAVSLDATIQLDEPEVSTEAVSAQSTANDTYRFNQWALDQVPFETMWGAGNGAGVTVAVVDTAIDLTHPDLAGQFVSGYHFLATGSGPGVASVPPGNFHGTHVAGIIAAIANNGTGIAGGAPGARIMPIEVLDAGGSGRYSDIISGIVYAADHGARVINLSLGGGSQSSAMDAAVAYAVSKGAIVMAAAGNSSCTVGTAGCSANYPAASPGATAIGSITSAHACSSFTTRASYVALGAPGSSIYSTAPTNLIGSGYLGASGTSMATPYASAAAATVISAQPSASAADVLAALESTAVDVADAGPDTCTGTGLIDPVAALDELNGIAPSPPTTVAPTSLSAPRLAGALGGKGMVRLSFESPAGATLIMIRRDGVLLATVSATRRSYTDRSVSARTQYSYTVTAFSDALGESAASSSRSATTRG